MLNCQGANELAVRYCELTFCWARIVTNNQGIVALDLASLRESLPVDNSCPVQHESADQCKGSAHRLAEIVASHLIVNSNLADLPIYPIGTPFQQLVWQYLRTIPYGTTVSYGEVARAIGTPKAVRAVANACARNTIALAIPCHRVVRKDGDHGGFRWGSELKREILRRERSAQIGKEREIGDQDERLS
jgi:AraC family transcriptional regulator of adaptative response/methylated-DNA-[protein]-cysteine methyltransferase